MGYVRLPTRHDRAGAGRRWPGRAYGGVLQRGAGLPVGVVPAAARADRVRGMPGAFVSNCRTRQQDAPGWQEPGAATKRRCLKPVSRKCRHPGSPAWLAREYEGRSAYEWAYSPHLGARSSMGGVAVPSPADKMQPMQWPGAAPWLPHPWLVPCVPHVWRSRAARAPRCGGPACDGLRHRCNRKGASQVTWGRR